MSEKLVVKLNGAIIMEQEKNPYGFFLYCEKSIPTDTWEDITPEIIAKAFMEVEGDLQVHQKSKSRWEHILQISRFNPSDTEEAYKRIEEYDEHIFEIQHTLHIIGEFSDIISLNTEKGIDFKLEWKIIEED